MKSAKTIFDQYLEEQLRDTDFASRFAAAGKAWDVALQITALRESRGLSHSPDSRQPTPSLRDFRRGKR